jgi:glycosyltransferase involved in cell wall biosynthesis
MDGVSVLIPFYNPGNMLIQAVNSVFEQIYENWKLILIDDASTDDSVTLISDYLKDPRVILLKNPQNAGTAYSLNQGLKHVDTPFVIQLDSDDFFYPHTLEILMNEAKSHSDKTAMVCGNATIVFENEHGTRWFSFIYKGKSFNDKYALLLSNQNLFPYFFRTNALIDVGGWPAENSSNGRLLGDKELLLRIIEKYHIHWIDQMVYHVRRHGQNLINEKVKGTYRRLFEEMVMNSLQRWGGEYRPIFTYNDGGWRILKKLERNN